MEAAVEWLLSSDEPGIRLLAKRDLLDEANPEEESLVLDGPRCVHCSTGREPTAASGCIRTGGGRARTGASCRWSNSACP